MSITGIGNLATRLPCSFMRPSSPFVFILVAQGEVKGTDAGRERKSLDEGLLHELERGAISFSRLTVGECSISKMAIKSSCLLTWGSQLLPEQEGVQLIS